MTSGEELSFDICIVGAGAAGITLALALRGSGLSVGLLESGGYEGEADTQALYDGNMTGIATWSLNSQRSRVLGGTSTLWAGWSRALAPEDFIQRDWVPESGWPITLDDLEPFYARAHVRVEIGDVIRDAAAVANAMGKTILMPQSTRVETGLFQYSPPTRFGERYRQDLEDADDITVVLYANLTDIVLNDALSAVERLEVRTLSGVELTAVADRYVLAMGGVENARILLASNNQLEEGVANSSDSVGRYFMEHPHYYGSIGWITNDPTATSFYEDRPAIDIEIDGQTIEGVPVMGTLELKRDVRDSEGLLRFGLQLRGFDINNYDSGEISPLMVQAMLRAESTGQRFLRCTLRCEQTPVADSRVTLNEELDALGMPRVDLDWRIAQEDHVKLRRAMQIMAAEIAASGHGRLWIPGEDAFSWTANPGGHHMGTTRMSAESSDGVVDADCKAHDLGNLYIAGSSVFRTGGDANPTLTIVALAERLADHLIGVGQ